MSMPLEIKNGNTFGEAIKNPHKAGWGGVQKSPRGAGLLHLREIALRNFLLKDF